MRVADLLRTQKVYYAVHAYDHRKNPDMSGVGYTDEARLILHIGTTAFLFGRHSGRTLVVEFRFRTTEFRLRFRILQTKKTKV